MSSSRRRSRIDEVRAWAEGRHDIRALALVGSHARGDARPDSDIDLVVLCSEPLRYLRSTEWVAAFGPVRRSRLEDWGKVRSIRVWYRDGAEVELGIAGLDWAELPLDRGTSDVLRGGSAILLDRDGLLGRAMQAAAA